jgi:hypothetical protein
MKKGRVSHCWDLLAPLICYVVNPHVSRKHALTPDKVHPFLEKKVKPFNRADWLAFKGKIKGKRRS